jgi:hypothetical protein
MKDLFVVVADKSAELVLKGILPRHESLRIRPLEFDIYTHPGRDGGARKNGTDLLAVKRRQYQHGLLLFDFEGSGAEAKTAVLLENELDSKLVCHWENNAKVIVIEPELDTWIWGVNEIIQNSIGWNQPANIRDWLRTQGFQFDHAGKPLRPKEAIERALRASRQPMSAALYGEIARQISLEKCTDSAFARLRASLQKWFAVQTTD